MIYLLSSDDTKDGLVLSLGYATNKDELAIAAEKYIREYFLWDSTIPVAITFWEDQVIATYTDQGIEESHTFPLL